MSAPTPDTATAAPAGPERRSRLRQYQVQLLERMQAAKSGAALGGRELGVAIGGRLCLLDLTQISEIVPQQPVTPVPLTRPWYLGLANIRGNLTGVIDLARYQGLAAGDMPAGMPGAKPDAMPGEAAAPERRYITFAPRLGFNCALVAERVLGLRKRAEMTPEPDAEGVQAWNGRRWRDADGRQWILLDLALLVLDPDFLQVGL